MTCLRNIAAAALLIFGSFTPTFAGTPSTGSTDPVVLAPEPQPAARGRVRLGYGRLVTNDVFITPQKDRWQTGSGASSRIWGHRWTGALPTRFGELLELRINAALMAPQNLRFPDPADRPLAAALSVGLHTHWRRAAWDMGLGADLVVTGPQTGIVVAQTALHDVLRIAPVHPSDADRQLGNSVYPTLVAEIGRNLALGRARLRPFAEARWGAETLTRAGIDLTIGAAGQGGLMIRDPITGQRYEAIAGISPGTSLVTGADIARVDSSVFLPERRGLEIEETRHRLRIGVRTQGKQLGFFYGVTWLSEEFKAQPEGQLVGSLRLQMRF